MSRKITYQRHFRLSAVADGANRRLQGKKMGIYTDWRARSGSILHTSMLEIVGGDDSGILGWLTALKELSLSMHIRKDGCTTVRLDGVGLDEWTTRCRHQQTRIHGSNCLLTVVTGDGSTTVNV